MPCFHKIRKNGPSVSCRQNLWQSHITVFQTNFRASKSFAGMCAIFFIPVCPLTSNLLFHNCAKSLTHPSPPPTWISVLLSKVRPRCNLQGSLTWGKEIKLRWWALRFRKQRFSRNGLSEEATESTVTVDSTKQNVQNWRGHWSQSY